MSNKFKKVICGFLSCAMLIGTISIAGFAEGSVDTSTVTEEDIAATEAPEATTAPETTTVPATSGYEDDNYYNKALALTSSLGIITGYDDGSVKPEAAVTRAEMAAIVLRTLNVAASSGYQNVFSDVDSSHWAADTIQTAYDSKIIDGYEDGTFRPDGDVLYEQVQKMLVCALNYETYAQLAGGYPIGYTTQAASLQITKNVKGTQGTASSRGEVIKMVYNTLLASYREITGYTAGVPQYSSDKSLFNAKFDGYYDTGILTATDKISIDGTDPLEGNISIEGTLYPYEGPALDDYVGAKVTYYYIDNDKDDAHIIAVAQDSSKSDVVEINADDIETMSVFGTNDGTKGRIKLEGKSTTYKVDDAMVVYNGTMLNKADYESAKAAAGSSTAKYKDNIDDFITPDVGTVRIVDYDLDGVYDVVFTNCYETLLVTSVSGEKSVTGKINGQTEKIDIENEDDDKTITVIKAGTEVKPKNLKKNDVVSLLRNVSEDSIKMVCTGESITGKLESFSKDDEETTAVINGTEYVVDKNAEDDCKAGINATFYFDNFERIGYIESSTGGILSGSEKYGWIVNAYQDDSGEDVIIKLYTQDGEVKEYKAASNINYWAYDASAPVKSPSTDELAKLGTSEPFIQDSRTKAPIKLVKYSVNSNDEITKLYVATEGTTSASDDRVVIDPSDLNGKGASGSLINGAYYLNDGGVEFTVPSTNSDMKDTGNYSISEITASNYLNVEGVSKDFVVGEFKDGRYPTVLIRFTAGSTNSAPISDYGTASDNPVFMVSNVVDSVDEDGEPVYTIKGYSGGSEISYTTSTVTSVFALGDMNPVADKNTYNGTKVFDATDSELGTEKAFKEAIKPGDIVGVQSNGSTANILIKMVDAENIASDSFKGTSLQWTGSASFSTTRDSIIIGKVVETQEDSNAFLTVKASDGTSSTVTFDISKMMDAVVVEMDLDGNIISTKVDKKGGYDITDLVPEGTEDNVTDYAFIRQFKGNMREIYIVRVNITE